jgi:hypothetical protein
MLITPTQLGHPLGFNDIAQNNYQLASLSSIVLAHASGAGRLVSGDTGNIGHQ